MSASARPAAGRWLGGIVGRGVGRWAVAWLVVVGLIVAGPATTNVAAQAVTPPPAEVVLRPDDLPPGFSAVDAPAASVLPDGLARQASVAFQRDGGGLSSVKQVVLVFNGRDAVQYGPRFRDLMIRHQGYQPIEGGDESSFALARTQGDQASFVVGRASGEVLIVTTVAGPTGSVQLADAEQLSSVAQARLPEPGSALSAANLSTAAPSDGGVTLASAVPRSTHLSYPDDGSGRGFTPVNDLPRPPTIDIIQQRPTGPAGEPELVAMMPEPRQVQRIPAFPNDPKDCVGVVKPLLDQFWARTFGAQLRPYWSPSVLYVRDGDEVPDVKMLVPDLSEVGHVYLPELELILLSEPAIYSEIYATPDWKPRAYVIVTSLAHEWGHHIQHLLGIMDARQGVDSFAPGLQPLTTREIELDADCYAGLFSRYARDTGWLSDHDLDEAMAVRERVGDFEFDDPNHHGTPAKRREWFKRGFVHYSMKACETW